MSDPHPGYDEAVSAATEAMSLPGEKGIVRSLTADDAAQAIAAAYPIIELAVRRQQAQEVGLDGAKQMERLVRADERRRIVETLRAEHDNGDVRATGYRNAADFIERMR